MIFVSVKACSVSVEQMSFGIVVKQLEGFVNGDSGANISDELTRAK